ncbi:MAG: MBL fold metallo-hydrolase [Caulobacteraceae bacterium]|nr:MBL fold metallo-hydrolase [Caulobacteraceae bacterium]
MILGLATAMLAASAAGAADPPSDFTRKAQAAARAAGAFEDTRDIDFASRGFLGTRAEAQIKTANGQVAWDLSAYDFLKGEAPASVEPGLWRQSQLLARHGLFEVKPGIWQVRGFDLANATFVRGKTGWIVIDTLGSAETARAAYDLVTEKLGKRPIVAIVYTHSHTDHFGGAGGLIDAADARAGKVKVIAPDGFLEHAVAENILAGPAMARRAMYQFGVLLPRGPGGQTSAGIGPGLSRGTPTLIAPNTVIKASGEALTIDGVRLEFQLTPNTEAPAEMNIYLPDFSALCMAENANATMHNVLTPRGALVRDAKVWADELTRSLRLYGDRADVMFTSHAWPRFGRAEVKDFLGKHRDAYKFLHDQSVRLMNAGLTGPEIAATLKLPAVLEREWYNHGFYGNMSFNSRAVYQRYMGWYDGNPARLAPLPPETAGKRDVEAMGGAAAVLARARAAFDVGDYAWSAELLDKLVFADPADAEARALLARAYDQLGYQSESSLWRNMYLSGAGELRDGAPPGAGIGQGAALLAAAPLAMMLDVIAVRIDPARVGEGTLAFAVNLTDTGERAYVSIANGVLVHEAIPAPGPVEATLTLSRADFAGLFTGGAATLPAKIAAGEVKIEGNPMALAKLAGWLDRPGPPFAIVTP